MIQDMTECKTAVLTKLPSNIFQQHSLTDMIL